MIIIAMMRFSGSEDHRRRRRSHYNDNDYFEDDSPRRSPRRRHRKERDSDSESEQRMRKSPKKEENHRCKELELENQELKKEFEEMERERDEYEKNKECPDCMDFRGCEKKDYGFISLGIIFVMIILSIALLFITFKIQEKKYNELTGNNLTPKRFINGEDATAIATVIGFLVGLVSSVLHIMLIQVGTKYLPKPPKNPDQSTVCNLFLSISDVGLGGGFAEIFGFIISEMITRNIKLMTGKYDLPLWSRCIGVIVGSGLMMSVKWKN